jgi:hypothetical protein
MLIAVTRLIPRCIPQDLRVVSSDCTDFLHSFVSYFLGETPLADERLSSAECDLPPPPFFEQPGT